MCLECAERVSTGLEEAPDVAVRHTRASVAGDTKTANAGKKQRVPRMTKERVIKWIWEMLSVLVSSRWRHPESSASTRAKIRSQQGRRSQ